MMIDEAGGTLPVVLRFLSLSATTGALGAWVFDRFVLTNVTGEAGNRHRESLRTLSSRWAMWCAAIVVLSAVPQLLAHAEALRPVDGVLATSLLATFRSRWGVALAAQVAAAGAAGAALFIDRRSGSWPAAAEAGIVALAIIPAFLGHAGAAHDLRVAAIVVDIIHVAAAGGWVGALGVLTASVLRARRSADSPALSAALIIAFHPVALAAAGAVFASGLGTAWLRMGAPVGIASSSYSGMFVAKLLLAGVTGAIGAGHSKLATRRMQRVEVRATSRSLLGECALAVVVLVVTAILAGTEPIG